MDASGIVGLASGLIAIFTFLTGIGSVRELRSPSPGPAGGSGDGGSRRGGSGRGRALLVLALSAPVFLLASIVSLNAGLAGSDTGGTQFALLVAGALVLGWYAVRLHRSLPWGVFALLAVLVLPALGYAMGTMSRGEEAEGATAGIVVGVGIALLGLAFRSRPPSPAPPPPAAPPPDREREVLGVVRDSGGEVTVGEVALNSSLGLDEARAALDHLVARGYCERVAVPGTAIRYRFPDFLAR